MPIIELPPFPTGWYAVAFSSELATGAVLTRQLAGREVIAYRTQADVANVMNAHCPHLGAHLGMGGEVDGDFIRCPFHGFCFDTDGTCVSTGYGTTPPAGLAATTWQVRETDGVLYVWAGNDNPDWTPPELGDEGWSPLVFDTFSLRDHPQETTENSVDLGHFAIVHGYRSVDIIEPVRTDGPQLSIGYSAERSTFGISTAFEYRIDIHGLGYSRVDLMIPKENLAFQLFILATPTDAEHVDLRIGVRIQSFSNRRPTRRILRALPKRWGETIVSRLVAREVLRDAKSDFPIWENKAYIHPPRLAEGDGPIGVYRKWARQFY